MEVMLAVYISSYKGDYVSSMLAYKMELHISSVLTYKMEAT